MLRNPWLVCALKIRGGERALGFQDLSPAEGCLLTWGWLSEREEVPQGGIMAELLMCLTFRAGVQKAC